MKGPVIVEALRTPIGRSRKGSLVTKGAFGLSLALKSGTGAAIDPHAGHNH